MPAIVDNNFSSDTFSIRLERLATIEANFSLIQTELTAPADIVTWTATCHSAFSVLLTEKDADLNESEAATLDASIKGQTMDEEYQNAKTFLESFLQEQPTRLKQFNFGAYPGDRRMKIEMAKVILDINERQIAEAETPNLPPAIVTRLTNAISVFETSLNLQDAEMKESNHSSFKLSVLFDKDTAMLQKLRSWWFIVLGKKDPRINIIGMVNPGTGGGVKQIAAPQNLRYQTDYMKVVWDAVENATSYSLEVSNDGVNYTELVSQSETEFSHIPYDVHSWFRVRSRSSAGLSEYSSVLEFWYYEPLPAPSNFHAEIIPGHQFKLSWDLIHSVTSYKIYISDVPFGDPESVFAPLYETSALEYTGSVTPGRRYYFKVTCFNNYQPESSYSSTMYVEVTGV